MNIQLSNVKFLLIPTLFFFIFSCKTQEKKVEHKLKKCVNQAVNYKLMEHLGKKDFDFYNFMKDVENQLLTKKILKDISQQSYLELFKKINAGLVSNIRNDIIKKSDSIGLAIDLFYINDAVFSQCPYKVTKNLINKKDFQIYKEGIKMSEMMQKGFDNFESIKAIIKSVNQKHFANIIYRAPVIYLAIINLKRNHH